MTRVAKCILALVIGVSIMTTAACGGSDDSTATEATDTTTASTATTVVNYDKLDTAVTDLDQYASKLPDDAQTGWIQLKADLATATSATGSDATAAWAKVKEDMSAVDASVTAGGADVEGATHDAWASVKTELDSILSAS